MSIFNDLPSTAERDEQIKQMQNQPDAAAQEAPDKVETAQLDGIGKWFEENVAIPVIDTLDQSRDADEVADDRTEAREGRQELDQYVTDNPTVLSETGTAVLGGAAQVVETGLNAADLAGDAIGGGLAAIGLDDRDSTQIPWSESYEWANYDLGIAENQTAVGKFGREIVAVLGGMAVLGGAGVGVGAGKSIASRVASEALRGGLYDFFADPGEGNLSNLVQSGPLANPLSKALAHEDEDNPWIRKLKNMVEGGTIGIAVDGLQELYGALRAGTKASAAAKAAGESPEKVAQAGTDAAIAKSVKGGALPADTPRKVENDLNSGRPDGTKPPTLDPQDRVSQTYKDPDINSSAASFYDSTVEGAGRSLVDEVDIQGIKTTEGLREFISTKLPEVDVDEISRRLSRQTPEHVQDTFRALAEFANSGEMSALEPLRFKNTFDIKGVDAGGAVVLDTLVKSMGERVSLLSKEVAELTELNAPFKTQARQLLDRVEGLVTVKKEATQFASKGLENWKQVPNQLKKAVDQDREKIADMFAELRKGLDSTDPEEVLEFKQKMAKLGMGLSASKGDPRLQMHVFEGIARVGWARANSVYINSLLSGPLTHARNISGNLMAIAERPLSRALGGGGGEAFAAYDGIYATLKESISIARKSLDSPYSITTASSKVADYAAQDRKVLTNALDLAQTDGERAVASAALGMFDFSNSPWFNWPGKALQAGDDLSKSLLARMEIRYEAAIEAKRIADAGDPRQLKQIKEDVYQKLASEKLSPNGAVLDSDLIDTVDAAAFQRPLQGNIANMGKAIQKAPGGRLILPFYKTGVNIARYGVQMSPLAPLSSEFRQVMKYGTVAEKQVMRGRMALGFTFTSMAASLASADLMTGYGPPYGHPDYDLWHSDHEPMSIRIGDKWVSYQAVPGLSLVMSAVSDLTMMGGELSDGNAAYLMSAIPYFIANAVTSQPMFQGVQNLAAILDTDSYSPETVSNGLGAFANNLLGGGSLRRTLEHTLTQNMSDYKNEEGAFISKHKVIGTITGGLLGEKVERINVLTGKGMPSKYSNKLNLLNPFTVIGKDRAPVLDTLEALEFPINLSIPNKVAGVKLTPDEKNLFGKEMYNNGNFQKSLQATLASPDFWDKYEAWQQSRRSGDAIRKEDSKWYKMLAKTVSAFQSKARNQLRYGTSETSQNYRDTFAVRASKLGSGSGGGLSPAEQGALREMNDLARWGKGQEEQN